jgi:hypothetical protein
MQKHSQKKKHMQKQKINIHQQERHTKQHTQKDTNQGQTTTPTKADTPKQKLN